MLISKVLLELFIKNSFSAIESKLRSNLPLKGKCTLAKNIFWIDSLAVGNMAQKEEWVISWIVSVLMKKFSQNEAVTEDEELWKLLHNLSQSAKFEVNFLVATRDNFWDLFNSIVDHSCQYIHKELPEKWMRKMIREGRHVKSELLRKSDSLNHWIAKCLQNEFIVDDALWLCTTAIMQHNSDSGFGFPETLLPTLLTVKTDSTADVCKLVSRSLFGKEKSNEWNVFLQSVIEQKEEDTKPKCSETCENLFMKLSSMSFDDQLRALEVLFKSAMMSKGLSEHSKSLLFCMCCDILQVYPSCEDFVKITSLASTLLPKFQMSIQSRICTVHCLIEYIIFSKFDLNSLLQPGQENSTMTRFFQYLLKHLFDHHRDQSLSLIHI